LRYCYYVGVRRLRPDETPTGDETMNATNCNFETITFLANEVSRFRTASQSAAEAVASVLFQYDWNVQGLVQEELERRDRY